jgi:alpha-glucosidase
VVRVRVRVPESFGPVATVLTRSNPDHEPRFSEARIVATADGWDWWEAEVEAENPIHGYRFLFTFPDGSTGWLNAAGYSTIETRDSEDFTLVTWPEPPAWGKNTVMYQIFPDRFGRSDGADSRTLPEWALAADWSDKPIFEGPDTPRQFYGGDLQGIIDHLDHLERLGVTMIYLTPIFPGRSNHRYDAHTFLDVDEMLGGNDALIDLVRQAHARGFTVIGDLTSNHSGDAHEWFQASHKKPGTPESDFYYWLDDKQEDYVSWLGVPSLPKFNWKSQELRNRFIEGPDSVVAKWLAEPYNLDGWRIDVANMTGRYLDEDLNQDVRRIIRRTMIDVNPDTILLGESTNDATEDFQGDAWHGAMTYANFTRPIWGWLSEDKGKPWFYGIPYGRIPSYTGTEVFEAHQRFTSGFPWRVRLHTMNALNTHDTARFRTSAIEGAVPVALGLSVSLPGIPVIFAGDEFGLTGDVGEDARTPMPWNDVDAAADTIDLYTANIALRTGHVALNEGGIRWLHASDDVLVFVREHADESVLVVAARGDFDVLLEPTAVAGEPAVLLGDALATRDAAGLRLVGAGPSFTAWHLPGVAV